MNKKVSMWSSLIGAGVIAASLAVVPLTLPAHAQSTGSGNNTGTTTTQSNGDNSATSVKSQATDRDNNDWGWLGLLGLIGLAGLAKRNHRDDVHYVNNDPNVGVRSGSDYR